MSDSTRVLDHGFVRLYEHMGNDLSVVRNARVSHDAAWRTGENEGSDHKLIHYLWRNKHTTPFEAVTFTFEVKAPIFIFRQWHRHRTWSFNEVSARHTELPAEFYVPRVEDIGSQAVHNKQARDLSVERVERVVREEQLKSYQSICKAAFHEYEYFLKSGWPRELARMILPVSTYSHMFATVNLNNLFKFLVLRIHPHAQWEIQQYAKALLELIEPIVPVCVKAFREDVTF